MIDSFYNRALGRMTRRELLNIAWKLGAAAIAQPIVSSRVLAQPLFAPTRSRSASRQAIPGRTAWCSGRVSRPSRSRAAACRWPTSTSAGRSRTIARSVR